MALRHGASSATVSVPQRLGTAARAALSSSCGEEPPRDRGDRRPRAELAPEGAAPSSIQPKAAARLRAAEAPRLWETWGHVGVLAVTSVFPLLSVQQQSKARKSCSKSKSRIDLLKKRLKDKIQLFDEQAPEDLVGKVGVSASSVIGHSVRQGRRPPRRPSARSP